MRPTGSFAQLPKILGVMLLSIFPAANSAQRYIESDFVNKYQINSKVSENSRAQHIQDRSSPGRALGIAHVTPQAAATTGAVAPAVPQLAPGWRAVPDASTGYTYYWNENTNEVTWTFPQAAPVAASFQNEQLKKERLQELQTAQGGGGDEDQLIGQAFWKKMTVGQMLKLYKSDLPIDPETRSAFEEAILLEFDRRIVQTPDLPEGWQAVADSDSGRTYYWNSVTSEVTWTKPSVAVPATEPAHIQQQTQPSPTVQGNQDYQLAAQQAGLASFQESPASESSKLMTDLEKLKARTAQISSRNAGVLTLPGSSPSTLTSTSLTENGPAWQQKEAESVSTLASKTQVDLDALRSHSSAASYVTPAVVSSPIAASTQTSLQKQEFPYSSSASFPSSSVQPKALVDTQDPLLLIQSPMVQEAAARYRDALRKGQTTFLGLSETSRKGANLAMLPEEEDGDWVTLQEVDTPTQRVSEASDVEEQTESYSNILLQSKLDDDLEKLKSRTKLTATQQAGVLLPADAHITAPLPLDGHTSPSHQLPNPYAMASEGPNVFAAQLKNTQEGSLSLLNDEHSSFEPVEVAQSKENQSVPEKQAVTEDIVNSEKAQSKETVFGRVKNWVANIFGVQTSAKTMLASSTSGARLDKSGSPLLNLLFPLLALTVTGIFFALIVYTQRNRLNSQASMLKKPDVEDGHGTATSDNSGEAGTYGSM